MMIWRRLREDVRECPATIALGLLWVVVFVGMIVDQATRTGQLTAGQFVLGLHNGHRFGDLTLRELFDGEIWRSLTATFVHYGVLHIGMNLYALYQLGGLVESWYGSGPFVAIYVLTGAGGNLVSVLIRQALRSNPLIASGGGSTVVMGLVALCAVVGWRSRTRVGDQLRNQMVWVLLLTGGIGASLSAAGLPVIDNWGHTGGAAVGTLIGLANRPLLRGVGGLFAVGSGWLGATVIAASACALVADDRAEAVLGRQIADQARERWAKDEYLISQLDKLRSTYRAVVTPRALQRGAHVRVFKTTRPPAPSAKPAVAAQPPEASPSSVAPRLDPGTEFDSIALNAMLRLFDALGPDLDRIGGSDDQRQARKLLYQTLVEPPTFDEVREFDDHLSALIDQVRRDRDAARTRVRILGG